MIDPKDHAAQIIALASLIQEDMNDSLQRKRRQLSASYSSKTMNVVAKRKAVRIQTLASELVRYFDLQN